jgi:hypothetical protein
MAADRSIVVRLKAVVSEYKQGMAEAAQSSRQVGDAAAKASQDSAKGFGAAASSVGGLNGALKGAIVTMAAAGIGAFVSHAVASFAQLEDASAAASVVFGNGMGQIIAQSETAAQSLGMAKSQVIDAANVFGTFGKSAGLAGKDLASFSTDMTQLAGDMASFKGTTPEQAIQAIGSALRGESEPIRAYGVLIDDASTKQQAFKMGLIATTKDALTPQQRVLAVQQLILQQTSDAQGDFARTADSTANVQKRLTAEWENAQATLGGKLAPYITAAQQGLLGLLQGFERNSAVLTPLIQLVGGLALGIGGLVVALKVADVVSTFTGGMQAMQAKVAEFALSLQTQGGVATASMMRMGNVVSGLGKAIPFVGVALVAAGAAFTYFGAKAEESRQQVMDLTAAIISDSGVVGTNARAYMAHTLVTKGYISQLNLVGVSAADYTDALLGNADAMARVQKQLAPLVVGTKEFNDMAAGKSGEQIIEYTGSLKDLRDGLSNMDGDLQKATVNAKGEAEANKTATKTTDDLAAASAEAAKRIQAQADAAGNAAKEIKDETAAMWAQIDVNLAATGSTRAVYAAVDAAAASFKENGKTLDNNTEKGRANADALEKIVAATEAAIQKNAENGASQTDLNGILALGHDKFVEVATSITGNKQAAEDLWATYKLNPGVVSTTVQQRGAESAQLEVQAFLDLLAKTPPEKHADIVSEFQDHATAAARAALASINDKTVTLTLTAAYNQQMYQLTGHSANGNLYHFYSNGGFENHVAQIAPKGMTRVWNEPETEGEAYIPLASSKRARSVAIWKQTGAELGVFADGGMVTARSGVQQWSPSVNMAAPIVYVQAIPNGEYVRTEARVVYGEESARQSRTGKRMSR